MDAMQATQLKDAAQGRNSETQRSHATQRRNGRARREGTTSVVPQSPNASHSVIPNEVRDLFLPLDDSLTQPPANALVGARHAVPLFHFRLSTVDCRLSPSPTSPPDSPG